MYKSRNRFFGGNGPCSGNSITTILLHISAQCKKVIIVFDICTVSIDCCYSRERLRGVMAYWLLVIYTEKLFGIDQICKLSIWFWLSIFIYQHYICIIYYLYMCRLYVYIHHKYYKHTYTYYIIYLYILYITAPGQITDLMVKWLLWKLLHKTLRVP